MPGAEQQEPHDEHENQADVDEDVLGEQDRPDDGDVGEEAETDPLQGVPEPALATDDGAAAAHPFAKLSPDWVLSAVESTGRTCDGRMLALVNYNADLAEYWEWSGQGFFPVDPTTEAYKLGVNYIVYALTH